MSSPAPAPSPTAASPAGAAASFARTSSRPGRAALSWRSWSWHGAAALCAPRMLDPKHARHPRDLRLPSSSLPMTVDVCRDAQGRMPEMAREPGDLPATLERSLGERVTEGVERSLLAGWTLARDIGLRQHRVELAEKPRRFDVAVLAGTREDELVVSGLSALTPPSAEEFDDIRSQVDVTPLAILRSVDPPPAARPAYPKHRLPEVD